MLTNEKSPARVGPAGLQMQLPIDGQKCSTSNRPVKWRRVLAALLDRSWNRFEAERDLHDHCLHTTIARIQREGITILRRFERVPGFQGIATDVCRYWVCPSSRERAMEILGRGR